MKIDKEQIRNVSLYSLNASEERNVKIMVSRGMTKMEIFVWQVLVGEKRESIFKKRSNAMASAWKQNWAADTSKTDRVKLECVLTWVVITLFINIFIIYPFKIFLAVSDWFKWTW